jgi:Na+/proline symporter
MMPRDLALAAIAVVAAPVAVGAAYGTAIAVTPEGAGLGALAVLFFVAVGFLVVLGLGWGLAMAAWREAWAPLVCGFLSIMSIPFLGALWERDGSILQEADWAEMLGPAFVAGLVVAGVAALTFAARRVAQRGPPQDPSP